MMDLMPRLPPWCIKTAIYNPSYEVDEVHDLQEMVPNMFWIFGEEYNIVTEAEPCAAYCYRKRRDL